MKVLLLLTAASLALSPAALAQGKFEGELILLPEGCQQTDERICRLGAPLRYTSPDGTLVWMADQWEDGNGQSGTTDGASIPGWAQPIIGDPFDEAYLKAAVVHDHYCYEENQVRSWRETHRMFYDALTDLKVGRVKAKIMYYAVYLAGPKWIKLKPGQNCGQNCINNVSPTGLRWEGDQFGTPEFNAKLAEMKALIEANPEMSLEDIEKRAEEQKPGDFFFAHGAIYVPTGPDDPNILPRL
jgi:hypothetical protein